MTRGAQPLPGDADATARPPAARRRRLGPGRRRRHRTTRLAAPLHRPRPRGDDAPVCRPVAATARAPRRPRAASPCAPAERARRGCNAESHRHEGASRSLAVASCSSRVRSTAPPCGPCARAPLRAGDVRRRGARRRTELPRRAVDARACTRVAADPLGAECAGVVSRSRRRTCTRSRVGDRVFGFAPASLATEAVVPCRLPGRRARGADDDDAAAALPVAFFTAHYGLITVPACSRGERVLIHAAAGGVGLAARADRRGASAPRSSPPPARPQARPAARHGRGARHGFALALVRRRDLLAATGGAGVDVVLNSLGRRLHRGEPALRWRRGGRFLELGKRDILSPQAMTARRPDVALPSIRSRQRGAGATRPAPADARRDCVAALADGSLKPLPVTVFAAVAVGWWPCGTWRRRATSARSCCCRSAIAGRRAASAPTPATCITGGLGALGHRDRAAGWSRAGARHLVLTRPQRARPGGAAADRRAGRRSAPTYASCRPTSPTRSAMRVAARRHRARRMPPLRGVVHAAGYARRRRADRNQRWDEARPCSCGKAARRLACCTTSRATCRSISSCCIRRPARVLGARGAGPVCRRQCRTRRARAGAPPCRAAGAQRRLGRVGWRRHGGQMPRRWPRCLGRTRPAEIDADAGLRGAANACSTTAWRMRRRPADRLVAVRRVATRWRRRQFFAAVAAAPASAQPHRRRRAPTAPAGAACGAAPRCSARPSGCSRRCTCSGLAPERRSMPGAPLKDIGLDSLMAVELRNALGARFEQAAAGDAAVRLPDARCA